MLCCLEQDAALPESATHDSLMKANQVCQHLRLCDLNKLEYALIEAMTVHASH